MTEALLGEFVVTKSVGQKPRKVPRQSQGETISDTIKFKMQRAAKSSLTFSAYVESLEPVTNLGSTYFFPETADDRFSELRMELASLREEISSLRASIDTLAQNMMSQIATPGAVNADREIPLDQAKAEIKQLFEQKGNLYYSEIAEELELDLGLVVQMCASLQEEGLIKENEARGPEEAL